MQARYPLAVRLADTWQKSGLDIRAESLLDTSTASLKSTDDIG
jgi:hypothetical protein